MKTQYIALLKKQIDKLSHEEFDLEAWKTGTQSVLQRIFGEQDLRVKHIEQLKIDYSSWALRDSNANYKPKETAKLKGKELLQTAIDEIDAFGVPTNNTSTLLRESTASEINQMNDEERRKHFKNQKKDYLVDLLMKMTTSK